MEKDYKYDERGNLLLQFHGLLFLTSSMGSCRCTILDRAAHATAFVAPVVVQWLEQGQIDLHR